MCKVEIFNFFCLIGYVLYLQIVMHSVMSLRLIGVITNLYIVLLITRSLDRNLRFERSVAEII